MRLVHMRRRFAMTASQPVSRTVIGGLKGLRNVVCLSAVLMSVGELPAVARVVRVDPRLGEIEVDGSPTGPEIFEALTNASMLLDELRRDDALDECCDPGRALDGITVKATAG